MDWLDLTLGGEAATQFESATATKRILVVFTTFDGFFRVPGNPGDSMMGQFGHE